MLRLSDGPLADGREPVANGFNALIRHSGKCVLDEVLVSGIANGRLKRAFAIGTDPEYDPHGVVFVPADDQAGLL